MWCVGFQCSPVPEPEIEKKTHNSISYQQYEESLYVQRCPKDGKINTKNNNTNNIQVEAENSTEPQRVPSPELPLPEIIGKSKFPSSHHAESIDHDNDTGYHDANEKPEHGPPYVYLKEQSSHKECKGKTERGKPYYLHDLGIHTWT